ncbi:uncharacterized protein LOC113005256 [Solenopsis invicta]|uniref:uncharacterized protein LOC113005256 n=1 Tax=Solenopsis invicta TaxID=13686 RepID=UPI00193CE510|nr:uncharacterized protein LOC113005256 [Solenopsis invicta]
MEPNPQFTSYPSTIRYWFATYSEARARLERATMHTDIESADDKTSRAKRKKKQIEDVSNENSNDYTDEELDKYSKQKSKKGKSGISNVKKRKIRPPQFPTFGSLPDVDVNKTTQNVEVSSERILKGEIFRGNKNLSYKKTEETSTKRQISNKPGQIVQNKRGKENIALNDQHDQSGIVENKRGKENIVLNDQHDQSGI